MTLKPSSQWLTPSQSASGATLELLRFIDDGEGGLVLADSGEAAVRMIDDGEGGQVLDDAATSGATIVATPIAIY